MNAVYLNEFIELPHSDRRLHDVVESPGYHGNAILTRFDILSYEKIAHIFQPFNWERDGHLKREPRLGK
jgi:hypothetical protein